MREIKFRAWDKTQNRMVPDKELQMHSLPDFRAVPLNESLIMLGLVYHLMQFTGLKDKNGKEIYEGDVVKCSDWVADANAFNEWDRTIEWDDKAGMWNGIDSDIIEVIGNIYE